MTDYAPLAAALVGDLVRPGDDAYDAARALYNAMVDKRPAAIARCAGVGDVQACVDFAHATGVDLAVRGGGHNGGGLGSCDGGLVIDLGRFREVVVDPLKRTVRVGGGCTLGEMDAATAPLGLAVPCGVNGTTGIGGLTLGGGVGNAGRILGLTIDSLLAAEVVLADGRVVTASASSEPDLFWGLRGGGGNLGVVTSFLFRCHPVGEGGLVYAGPVLYPRDQVAGMLRWYADLLPTLPLDVSAWAGIGAVPPLPGLPEDVVGQPCGFLLWCYTGPHDRAGETLGIMRRYGDPLLFGVQEMSWVALQSAFDALFPAGQQWYWRGDFVTELTDEAIGVHVDYLDRLPSPQSLMHLYAIDGVAAQVGEADTAFAYRDGGWAGVIAAVDPDPALAPVLREWATSYWAALHGTTAGGAYVNFLMDEDGDRVRASYRGNWERLTRVKRAYDPGNLFHVNQNVPPAD